MDPDVALENMRAAIAEMRSQLDRHVARWGLDASPTVRADALIGVLDSWSALDGWLSKGGYRPEDWKP